MTDVVEQKCEPIIHLMTALQMSGENLIRNSGYLAALLHVHDLGAFRERLQIDDARKAIARAAAALDVYEAATKAEREAA